MSRLLLAATDNEAIATLPAGTSLLRARLTCYTYIDTHNTTRTFQISPPNTLLGVYWKATGGAVPLITDATMGNPEWYVAGYGELQSMDRGGMLDTSVSPAFIDIQSTYSNFLDFEEASYQSASFDIGVSINFLGGGFWTNPSPALAYQFTYWTD